MKKSTPRALPESPADQTQAPMTLRLRRRPVANLTEDQMEDAAGGHANHTCEPTCPPTCCPTCPDTCGRGDTCRPTCLNTCPASCDTCYPDCDL